MGSISLPGKANPPLIVDPDAVLSGSIPFQPFQSVARRGEQVLDVRCIVEHGQFPLGRLPETGELPYHIP